ncbi:hypothetical protein FNW52_20230 [Flavobacterium sp. ZT3R18]|uniref:hypothetical protein n=1 Tax=Flavobacterium sp. ZT3R18 TaxID=2594429 RepID=UPI00117AF8B0|nr:hypothetical protein [Flavobacterium sp. ZT3R18]TRX30427.1 hypothetical protein FNW52_20230 [Flavobacterium sp. ZT3R18]
MEEQYENGHQLKDFVETHNLMNRNSIVNFNSIVSITTANNKITNRKIEVMVSFDNYNSLGLVTFLESDIDTSLFPTVFEANWQKMEHIENEFLKISDIHKKNPLIGEYTVKITPLEKIRD